MKGCAMPTPHEPGASRQENDRLRGLKISWRGKRALKKNKRRPFLPDLGGLEPRMLLATFLVTTTADSGSSPLSLRQAIIDSNAAPGLNTIDFSIGAVASQQTIAPASALPAITNAVLIDGWSQGGAGYTGVPLIVINGSSAGAGSDGLDLDTGSDGSTIRALVINDFGGVGISIATSGNLVESAYIGTDVSGAVAAANGTGVEIASGGANNTIGGTAAGAGNLISGNAGEGVEINGAGGGVTGNVVAGNLIGTDVSGENALGNTDDGIYLANTTGNTIGGPTSASRNVIAADGLRGIELDSANSNMVEDNFIGTDAMGSTAMGVGHNGIYDDGTSNMFVGNVIDASGNIGLVILGGSTLVQGNLIGLNAAGTAALGNVEAGILIGASGNTIGGTTMAERNVIAGTVAGTAIGVIVEAGGDDNLVEGNYVGTNATGTAALPNGTGIAIEGGTGNTIGGATSVPGTGAGNVISGNADDGLDTDPGSVQTIVLGNIIGLDAAGTAALENGSSTNGNGISLNGSSDMIGGTAAGDSNIISGNYLRGVSIGGSDELVEGNFIGTDITGMIAIGNGLAAGYAAMYVSGSHNTIGGSVAGAGNLLDGSGTEGIRLDSASSVDNLVAGNDIGVNAAGTGALGNKLYGVLISNGATGNTIGGPTTAYANAISGNLDPGVDVDGAATIGDVVANDWIGTDAGGTGVLLNGSDALVITNGASILVQGSFTGNVNNQGTLGFFGPPSVITITGNFTQTPAGTLDVDLGGTSLSQHDQLQISGTATLAGTLDAALINSFSISPLDEFQIVTYGTVSGTFATYQYPNGVTLYPGYGPTSLFLYSTPFELVTNTADSGAGSLRQAMTSADALTNNPTWIVFNIPTSDSGYASGVWTISPLSALPEITAQVVLDGSTQPGFTVKPIIVLSGTGAGASAAGMTVVGSGSGSTVRGLVVNGFGQGGINLHGASNTTIEGNFIGTNAAGTAAIANGSDGVEIDADGSGNTIGGTTTAARNVISANAYVGVKIDDANDNVVEGDFIGTDVTGKVALGNNSADVEFGGGVLLYLGASGNTIGGLTATPGAGAGNLISGNTYTGVWLDSAGPDNLVAGNLIGTNVTGSVALGNDQAYGSLGGAFGVAVQYSPDTIVGEPGGGNVIAGNGLGVVNGANVDLIDSSGSVVQSNIIGTDITGTVALSTTTYYGVLLELGSYIVGGLTPTPGTGPGNVISGNGVAGIFVANDTAGSTTVIEGNIIGADATGEHAVPNRNWGVDLGDVSLVTIGGTAAGAGNLISGNSVIGVYIDGSTATANLVAGNFIGTDIAGKLSVANLQGIVIADGASNNTIGGPTTTPGTGAGNVISGNTDDGVQMTVQNTILGATGNLVEGNLIGTDKTGTAALANGYDGVELGTGASGDTIGGTTAAARNVISANANAGVEVDDASDNVVEGDYIGTDWTGTMAIGNGTGVEIDTSAAGNTIGGTTSGARDVISGNSGFGLLIQNTTSSGNFVEGDYIGTDMTGNAALGNLDGIVLFASDNTIGGTVAGAGNIIAGNDGTGFIFDGSQILIAGNPGLASDNNLIAGNYIGLDAEGQALAGATGGGIVFDELTAGDTTGNTIGGTTSGARNVISGNLGGIGLAGDNGNLVEGNYIGTDPTGTIAIGNEGYGDVDLVQGASNDTIGGTTAGARNIISGDDFPSGGAGVGIDSTTNCVVEGNFIGTDVTGTKALPNFKAIDFGAAINSNDTIGGATATPGTGAGNFIAGNANGIYFNGQSGLVAIEGNAIGQVSLPGGGTSPGNGIDGIDITSSSSSILVGGTSPLDENVISGNASDGIEINASSGVLVEGNLIGTNLADTAAVPNANGVVLDNGSTGNTIGGASSGAGNVISGNTGDGIMISGASSTTIQGNTIGSSPGLGNGVGLYDPSNPVSLGGPVGSESNFYGYNRGPGVLLGPAAAVGSSARGERFAGDSEVGILIGTPTTPTSAPPPSRPVARSSRR